MKELLAYQCETCKEIYNEKSCVRKCSSCKVEICDECSSMDDCFCWKCYEEEKDLLIQNNKEEYII